jgi:anti-sigma regulatory factor (Ser/Thr protein kinase)
MANRLSFRFKVTLEEISRVNEEVSAWMNNLGVSSGLSHLPQLAIEELGTNVLKYGHDDDQAHEVDVELELSESGLQVTFTDDGRPFNPLETAAPDVSLPLEERAVGGLGIHLLRSVADTLEYQRVDGKNRIRLFKQFNS